MQCIEFHVLYFQGHCSDTYGKYLVRRRPAQREYGMYKCSFEGCSKQVKDENAARRLVLHYENTSRSRADDGETLIENASPLEYLHSSH